MSIQQVTQKRRSAVPKELHDVRVIKPLQFDHHTPQTSEVRRLAAISHPLVGSESLWAGVLLAEPNTASAVHHHGSSETVAFVLSGQSKIRWGSRLEHEVELEAGDFLLVPPYVPHQEVNPSPDRPTQWVVVGSGREAVLVKLTKGLDGRFVAVNKDEINQPLPTKFSLLSAVRLRCPRCKAGKLFRGWFGMNRHCPKCGLELEREQGFYLASIYFNYGATALISAIVYTVLAIVYDYSPKAVLAGCVAFTIVFPLWFFRYARSFFLAIDYYIHPEGGEEGKNATSRPFANAPPPAIEGAVDQASSVAVDPVDVPIAARIDTAVSPFTDEQFSAMRTEDAHAGIVVGLVVSLAILFGLTLAVVVLWADAAAVH